MTTATATEPPDLPRALLLTVFLPFAGGFYLSYLYRAVNAVISGELQRELGLDAGDLGLLTSAYFLTFAVFQIPLGVLLDRFSPRRINALLLLFAGAGALAFAWGESVGALAVARGLIGFGVSACLMGSMKAFVLWFPMRRLASLNGWLMAVGGLGAMTAAAPIEAMLGIAGWRGVFLGLGALTFAVAGLVFFVVPEKPPAGERERIGVLLAGVAEVFGSIALWRLALVCMTIQATFLAVQGLWAASWLRDVAGFDRARVGMVLLGYALAMTAGFAFFGSFADRMALRGGSRLAVFKAGTGLAIVSLAVIVAVPGPAAIPAWVALNFFSTSAALCYALLANRFRPALSGRVNTTINLLIFVAAFATQWGIGLVMNLWPSDNGLYPVAAYRAALGVFLALGVAAFLQILPFRDSVAPEAKPGGNAG